MTAPDCRNCPTPCRRTDCPQADREWRPGTEEEELGAAHEPYETDGEESE